MGGRARPRDEENGTHLSKRLERSVGAGTRRVALDVWMTLKSGLAVCLRRQGTRVRRRGVLPLFADSSFYPRSPPS